MMRLVVALTVAASLCGAATFYVSPTGVDKNPGTAGAPWATLQHAVDTITPGDIILVESGTYVGCRISNSGTEQAPKTLKAAPGAKVLINAPGPQNKHNSVVEIENNNKLKITDWVVGGVEITNSPRYGIHLRVSNRITIDGNHVHDSRVTGIFTSFSDHVLIENNESDHNGEHGIYHSNSSVYGVIRANRSHHNASAGIHLNGDLSQGPPGLIQFTTVESNLIWENGLKGASGINCDGVDNSTFRYNVLTNNHANGISLYAVDAVHSSSHNKVYNNTIIMAPNSRWAINIPDDGAAPPPVGNDVQFNVLYTPDKDHGSILTWSPNVPGFVSDHNTVVGRFSTNGGSTILTQAQWQALGYDKHSVLAPANCQGCLASNPAR
jgi:parallel beta-helix repeat protein